MDTIETEELNPAALTNQELADVISRTRYQLDYCPPESITHKRLQAHLKRMLDVEYQRAKERIHISAEFDLVAHLRRQIAFSLRTFGPGYDAKRVVAHIRSELKEVLAAPKDIEEWADVILLAFDGAWRTGATPEQIVAAVEAKQTKNESRQWPDWRTQSQGQPIKHIKHGETKE